MPVYCHCHYSGCRVLYIQFSFHQLGLTYHHRHRYRIVSHCRHSHHHHVIVNIIKNEIILLPHPYPYNILILPPPLFDFLCNLLQRCSVYHIIACIACVMDLWLRFILVMSCPIYLPVISWKIFLLARNVFWIIIQTVGSGLYLLIFFL